LAVERAHRARLMRCREELGISSVLAVEGYHSTPAVRVCPFKKEASSCWNIWEGIHRTAARHLTHQYGPRGKPANVILDRQICPWGFESGS
jgi:hypothetical protein